MRPGQLESLGGWRVPCQSNLQGCAQPIPHCKGRIIGEKCTSLPLIITTRLCLPCWSALLPFVQGEDLGDSLRNKLDLWRGKTCYSHSTMYKSHCVMQTSIPDHWELHRKKRCVLHQSQLRSSQSGPVNRGKCHNWALVFLLTLYSDFLIAILSATLARDLT